MKLIDDNISIRMAKVCGPSIYNPLEIISNPWLETGIFPSQWKGDFSITVEKR